MPRAPNFTYRNPLEDIGPSLVRALLGDPAMAAAQRQQQSEMDLREAQAAMARSHGGLYDSQTTGVDQQNAAAQGMPGFFAKMYEAPPPMPSLDDPNFVQDAGPSAPLPTRDEIFRAGLPAFLGNAAIMQGDKIDPRHMIGTAASFGGGDEMARRGLIAQGHTPTKDFAITPGRADEISARDAGEDRTTKFGVAGINRKSAFDVATVNNRDDVPVANIRAGATVRAAQVGADGRANVANIKATGPAPGFDAITRSFPGVTLNSGWRSEADNRRVDGVGNSLHLGKTPGVQAYDIDPIPGMTVSQAARKIEADSGGTIQVVEEIDERGRTGPNGKKLGGWHFSLKNVGGPAAQPGKPGKPGAAAKPPRLLSKAALGMIDTELKGHLQTFGLTLDSNTKGQVRNRALEIYQQTGNPVGAVRQATLEWAQKRRAKVDARGAPRAGAIPTGAPTATGPGGKKMYFDGKAWVPAKPKPAPSANRPSVSNW